ncbi:hypothetical protein HV454_08210 [Bacillus sporothermodurans]|uniref:hypothetical protein n=1 Tax=Heyndrickxia sporothermodurans TaxID=46224 RepID=UPI001E0BF1A3|nr:hypothetical protein [Heyndrickxia sporothermodurans]MBL5770982.1 hypothetical protein [Heyndrickxia sporothermodurans]MBL5774652.1 hypothetical protein [Heyndrickxia sporothermodurans]MBL5777742.1 hypothetical protein [Heyndrickxia sporothermodurans]MBL5781843.1 hypothetical protein [Heyndrickxia sporothermodurans]
MWKDVIGLVGKGVTFDTGGYSLKTKAGIVGMKTDMGGAAAVLVQSNRPLLNNHETRVNTFLFTIC